MCGTVVLASLLRRLAELVRTNAHRQFTRHRFSSLARPLAVQAVEQVVWYCGTTLIMVRLWTKQNDLGANEWEAYGSTELGTGPLCPVSL